MEMSAKIFSILVLTGKGSWLLERVEAIWHYRNLIIIFFKSSVGIFLRGLRKKLEITNK